jgi:hypothetical protein
VIFRVECSYYVGEGRGLIARREEASGRGEHMRNATRDLVSFFPSFFLSLSLILCDTDIK